MQCLAEADHGIEYPPSTMDVDFTARPPASPLDRHVELLWHYSDYMPDHTLEKLLPDGAVELIIDLTDFPKRLHDPVDLRLKRLYRKGWISGMRSEYLVIGAEPGSSMMGIRFRPGGVGAYLPCPAEEITEQVIELEDIWGDGATSLRDRLLEADGPGARFRIVEEFLHGQHRDRFAPTALVLEALDRLRRTSGPIRVRDVAEELGVSQKHLIGLFDRSVGLKPKAMHRVFRFINVLERIEGVEEVDWAGVALDCGYYDQAHFNREFRAFAGATPTHYLERGGDLMFYMLLDSIEEPISRPVGRLKDRGEDPVKDLQDSPAAVS